MAINKIDEVVIADSLKQIINNKSEKTYVDDLHTTVENDISTGDINTLNSAKSYTDTKVADIVNSAPGTLDTLNELAKALGDDPNFATTISTNIGKKADKIASPVLDNILSMDSNGNLKDGGIQSSDIGQLSKIKDWTSQQNFNAGAPVLLTNNVYQSTDLISTYPVGYSIFKLVGQTNGFPITTNNGFVVTFNFGNCGYQDIVEMYTGIDTTVKTRKWFREERDSNDFWQPFEEIFTDGYMGSGSGLDADKLDGQDSSYYLDYTKFTNTPDTYTKTEMNTQLNGKANTNHTHTKEDITDFPSLATVATSGKYSDLSGNPTIPTKVSQLTNDSSYVTSMQLGNAGYGDMMKSTYDKNGDGIVDNAEALQGHTASDFAYGVGITTVDLNTIIQSGMYRINTNLNSPGISYGQILVMHGGADTIAQIVMDYSSNLMYWRSGNPSQVGGTGSWCPWRKIWHDGNFNPSSIEVLTQPSSPFAGQTWDAPI